MGVYAFLRKIGHKYFPALIEPYRSVRFWVLKWAKIPNQLHDIAQISNKTFDFKTEGAISLEQFYNGAENADIKRGIIFMCDGRLLHGGPSDRLRGILTTYREARKRGIPFFIHWNYPFILEDYLVPADVDWRIKPEQISYSPAQAYPVVIMETSDPQTHADNSLRVNAALKRALPQTHVYSNAANAKKHYEELYRQLFKPSKILQEQIDRNLSILGDKYYSFTFRFLTLLGDFNDHLGIILPPEEATLLIGKVTSEFKKYLAKIPSNTRILVTSDSMKFLKHVAGLDSRIHITPGNVANIDLSPGKDSGAWLKTFTDQQLIMRADRVYLFRTGKMYKSGFPEFAARVGGTKFIDHRF